MKLVRLVLPTMLGLLGIAWIVVSHFDGAGNEREHHFIYGLLFLILSFLLADRMDK